MEIQLHTVNMPMWSFGNVELTEPNCAAHVQPQTARNTALPIFKITVIWQTFTFLAVLTYSKWLVKHNRKWCVSESVGCDPA